MARGQRTFLQLVNRALLRLGKSQTTVTLSGAAADSWPGIVRDTIVDALYALTMEHDWSTLITSRTFSTSSRTVDMSTVVTVPTGSFTDFQREISLVDTTNETLLVPVLQVDIDALDPGLNDSGTPIWYSINYPDLLFDTTPSASTSYRFRYVRRATELSANADLTILPEYCDDVIVDWAVREMAQTREDDTEGGRVADTRYRESLARAIAQDVRRMDRVHVLQPRSKDRSGLRPFSFPPDYPATWGKG